MFAYGFSSCLACCSLIRVSIDRIWYTKTQFYFLSSISVFSSPSFPVLLHGLDFPLARVWKIGVLFLGAKQLVCGSSVYLVFWFGFWGFKLMISKLVLSFWVCQSDLVLPCVGHVVDVFCVVLWDLCPKHACVNDLQLYVTSFLPFCSDCLDFSLPYSVLLAREWNAKRMLSLSLWSQRSNHGRLWGLWGCSFPDFNEFTPQFEKEDESNPNIDWIPHSCPLNPLRPPLPVFSLNGAPIFSLNGQSLLEDPKWIPETQVCATLCGWVCLFSFLWEGFQLNLLVSQLCEQERNEFSLNGQSLLERYNEIKVYFFFFFLVSIYICFITLY